MADLKFGVDCSNYSGIPTPAQVRAIAPDWVSIGTQDVQIANGQAMVFAFCDVPIEWYTFPQHIDNLHHLANPNDIVSADFEKGSFPELDAQPVVNVQAYRDAIDNVMSILDPYSPGIYTSPGWWKVYTGDWDKYKDRRLWVATYPGQYRWRPLPMANDWPIHTWQYAGTIELSGFSVDLNARPVADTLIPIDLTLFEQQRRLILATMPGGLFYVAEDGLHNVSDNALVAPLTLPPFKVEQIQ